MSSDSLKVRCYNCGHKESDNVIGKQLQDECDPSAELISILLKQQFYFHTCSRCGTFFRVIASDIETEAESDTRIS